MTEPTDEKRASELPAIPGFRIERELGQGGMARVYLAFQEKLERHVALKVLKASMSDIPDATMRFLKEAKTSAKLVHPNIITVYDADHAGDLYYMAMEFLAGGNLLDRLPRSQDAGMEPRAALLIARKVALALAYAHNRGTIHRDIKPENVMFRADGTPVLVDFGIARATDSATQYTQQGMSIGTPWYMSPEQVRGERVDGRSDLYSLGVVIFQLFTGRVPFEAPDPIAVAVKHLHDEVPRLPAPLLRYQRLIDSLLAKNPAARVQNGDILVSMIDSYLDDTRRPAAAPPPAPPPAASEKSPRHAAPADRTAVRPPPWQAAKPVPPRVAAPPPLSESQEMAIAGAPAAAPRRTKRGRARWTGVATQVMIILGAAQLLGGLLVAYKLRDKADPTRIIIHAGIHALLCLLFLLAALAFRHGRARSAARIVLGLAVLIAFSPFLAGLASVSTAAAVLLADLVWAVPLLYGWRELE